MKAGAITRRNGWTKCLLGVAGVILVGIALLGCKGPEQVDKNVVRTIKWTKLASGTAVQERRIAGVVEPVQMSELSFEVAGRIQKLHARRGDRVKAGDMIAELDREPFKLRLRHAEAEVSAALAVFKEEAENLQRQRTLFKDGWIAKARLESALAGHDAALSQLRARRAQLELRRRDLKLSVLRAPFDGVISKKTIEAFEEVATGQAIFELNGEGDLKVSLRVPPALITRLEQGQGVAVHFPTQGSVTLAGVVAEIGTRAETANAFPITVRLRGRSKSLRAGMTAEVVFDFGRVGASHRGLMVPMSAILSGRGQDYHVFRFDPATSTVSSAEIEIEGFHEKEIQIAGDLRPGDIIATAGVEFLTEGQKVRLMGDQAPYGEGAKK